MRHNLIYTIMRWVAKQYFRTLMGFHLKVAASGAHIQDRANALAQAQRCEAALKIIVLEEMTEIAGRLKTATQVSRQHTGVVRMNAPHESFSDRVKRKFRKEP